MTQVPRTLHYVWLGDRPPHPLMVEWREGWTKLHPDWEVKVWCDLPELPPHLLACGDELVECRYPDYLAACPTHAKRSDVWRYDILEQQGGVYLDADVEPVKCIDPLLTGCTAFAGLCLVTYDWKQAEGPKKVTAEVACSIMGATPHHPWLREVVARVPTRDPEVRTPASKLSLAFPFLTSVTTRHPGVRLFPPEVFYPFPWSHYAGRGRDSLVKEKLPEATYAVHRWSSLWFPWGGVRRRA